MPHDCIWNILFTGSVVNSPEVRKYKVFMTCELSQLDEVEHTAIYCFMWTGTYICQNQC